jgi:hypothetical protein
MILHLKQRKYATNAEIHLPSEIKEKVKLITVILSDQN